MLEQDFSKIDLTKADFSNPIKLKDGRTVYKIGLDDITGAYSNYDQAVVHGTILVEKVSKNSKIVQVVYNKELGCRCGMYDFEQHSLPSIRKPGQFFKTIGRNLATWWGKKVNETNHLGEKVGGKPFMIKYNGTNSIY